MKDILIGIDAGTSVIKSVAFDLEGRQIAMASKPNRYQTGANGAAFQDMTETWKDCAETLVNLGKQIPDLGKRAAALAVTAQGDGTWLIDSSGTPVTDGWIWLDARAAALTAKFRDTKADRVRYEITGTGLNACQQSTHLLWMKENAPELLDHAAYGFHPKDWLYFNLTGEVATDPSEGSFTFGNFRTRQYSEEVIGALGLEKYRHLLPPMLDGSKITHPLSETAAGQTGLLQGLPVSLGYVDVVCTAMGAGLFDPDLRPGCTIVGSTGMHLRATAASEVQLNDGATGYVMVLPVDGYVAQIQSNMASTLNIDWILDLGVELASEMGASTTRKDMLDRLEGWLEQSEAAGLLYQPYISDAGERGPFVDSNARAGFTGLRYGHRYHDLVRAVVEGLGFAARDCYSAMGNLPEEVRMTGGAARSEFLRKIIAACLGANVRCSAREEAGAAGAAMMAAVAIGAHSDMIECVRCWADPLLGETEPCDQALAKRYENLFPAYQTARQSLSPVWASLTRGKDPS